MPGTYAGGRAEFSDARGNYPAPLASFGRKGQNRAQRRTETAARVAGVDRVRNVGGVKATAWASSKKAASERMVDVSLVFAVIDREVRELQLELTR